MTEKEKEKEKQKGKSVGEPDTKGETVRALWQAQTDNLTELHTRICSLWERDFLSLREIIPALRRVLLPAGNEDNTSRMLSFGQQLPHWQEVSAHAEPLPIQPLPQCREQIGALYQQFRVAEQIDLCRGVLQELDLDSAALTSLLFEKAEPIPPDALGAVAYQHNIYADEAYLHFARFIPGARAGYFDSFGAVCEQVYNGISEYCILPLENSREGKLSRFYGLIEKYELKIVLTCEVTTADNQHTTTFGLCRRSLLPKTLLPSDRKPRLELIFWQDTDHPTVGELLTAAEICSLRLLRADCLPRSDDEILMGAGYPFDLSFELDDAAKISDLYAFLLYLTVHSPSYLPLGIYQHL